MEMKKKPWKRQTVEDSLCGTGVHGPLIHLNKDVTFQRKRGYSGGRIPMCQERAEAIARFRLATGHDYLQAHLYRIGLGYGWDVPIMSDRQCGRRSPAELH
ncbi:hypothetical protein CDAR_163991 [Caerostris darwini]|uniref:Uncharacterized protein n=1 Tax=Caerostris darwini TaxID=1538125 RepID=A0AAV4UVW1_9ARAC|nr:hypothetical protein CDAR_163991 [Caerostris darwini]